MTILVVDDEPAVPRLFEQRFRKEIRAGLFSFLFAPSGEQALDLIDQGIRPGIILSDINMPGMTGLEFLDGLRLRGSKTPVYMVSAYDDEDFGREARARGAAGFLSKPLRFEDLCRLFDEQGAQLGLRPSEPPAT